MLLAVRSTFCETEVGCSLDSTAIFAPLLQTHSEEAPCVIETRAGRKYRQLFRQNRQTQGMVEEMKQQIETPVGIASDVVKVRTNCSFSARARRESVFCVKVDHGPTFDVMFSSHCRH